MKSFIFAGSVGLLGQAGDTPPPSFKNIKIANPPVQGFSPCEPSIAVSKKNPNNIVAGVVLDRSFATADGGQSWTETKLTSPFGVFGDPALVSDANGDFYFFHLGSEPGAHLGSIVCQKSTDGGKTWSPGASIGKNLPKQTDKQWATTHPTKPYVYTTFTQFDKYGAKEPGFDSNIMFSNSMDGGATWSKAVQINEISGDCLDDDGTTEGAVPAVDKDGKIYVVWSSHQVLFFDRSYDNGKTWLKHDIPVTRQYGGWNMTIPGLGRSNGMPVLTVDNSKGPNRGNLYLLWADQRNGEKDTDIFLCKSTDHGDTWSQPKRVNQDGPGKQQFMPWLSVDPATGYLYVVYYDRRAYEDQQTDVYIAYSTDGGNSFQERKLSESPFTPTEKAFFGDYNNISANKGTIAVAWTRMDEAKTSVWTAIVKQDELIRKR